MQRRIWTGGVLLGLVLTLSGSLAHAVITSLTPLSLVIEQQHYICVAAVEKLYPEKPGMVLKVNDDLRGKLPCRRLSVILQGDSYAQKNKHTPQLLKRLAPELPVLLFANQAGTKLIVFAYTNGTWFQMVGSPDSSKATAILEFTHCEPYLRRTFKGTTAELRQVIADGLSGKRKPPEPNAKEPPGLGPEIGMTEEGKASKIQQEKSFLAQASAREQEPISYSAIHQPPATISFAVIPTLGIGGPLAVLALLFPGLFGGVLVLFRRWQAFFTVISTNCTLLFCHWWFGLTLAESWWGTPTALWLVLTLINFVGVLWAWRRNLSYLHEPLAGPPPERTEHIILWVMSLSCVAGLVYYSLPTVLSLADPSVNFLLVLTVAVGGGTLYKLYRTLLVSRLGGTSEPLPTEGVMLWLALGGFITLQALLAAPTGGVSSELANQEDTQPVAQLRPQNTWQHIFKDRGNGLIVSTPLAVQDRVYVAAAHRLGFETFGAVYCLDAQTKKVLWSFDDDHGMKQVFSSPCVADGRLYIGEGFHDDQLCKIYCLNTRTGEKLWEAPTGSQTESSPCVANGKVFCGAGNDGVLALDAKTGKRLWQFPPQPGTGKLLRFGAPVVVQGNRLYIGTGVDRNRPEDPGETALFCLDADSGQQLWKVPVELPCWAGAVVNGGQVFFALGNGDIFTDAAKPAGAVICLDAQSGKQLWRHDAPGSILNQCAVADGQVYFGCRDGHAYCLNRSDGKMLWKKEMGSPVVAAPALAGDGRAAGVFVIATAGRISCLDPQTGQSHWIYHDLEKPGVYLSSSPVATSAATEAGMQRHIYFGAALNNLSVPALYRLEDVLPKRHLPQ